jgi:hypothetical protein
MAQINKPSEYFNTKLYTGNGSTQSITGVGFQPDLLWFKNRNSAINHMWFDSVRGIDKYFYGNLAEAEGTSATILTAVGSDGFSVGANNNVNGSGNGIVSWNWKANGSGSANTDGDVTSTVSVNTTSGFSIVKWDSTGTAGINIGHGLGQKPAMIIAKCLNQSSTSWPVYHQSLGATKYVSLQATTAETTSATRWNNSEPTTITFQTGSSGDIGGSDRTMIAYCFAEKKGFSKFGKYTGNGSTDGTFVYTGFKPAFIIYKGVSGTGAADNWEIHDNKRDISNPMDTLLYPNSANAESIPASTTDRLDFLSNGFKIRTGSADYNASGTTYIYMAFAENPLVGTNNIPTTAR